MNRLMVSVVVGVAVVLAVPIAAVIGFSSWEEGKCKEGVRELRRIRGAVAAELAVLNSPPLRTVAVCDSGDSPYLATRLDPSIPPQQVTRHLESRGWRIADTYRRPDGEIWSWEMQKMYQTKSAHLSIIHQSVTGPVSISVSLL
ncbi:MULTISPECIES: hypothetical protein [unclassified Spirillospora]|uniref:hypothetical protein n=1 Tax=unclassified Spirillospora TaxID=2642701 RepID=UPI003714C0C8